ncbi:MAG: HNH endonuclease [Deltaproteobacteria bacterium]|nr:HNH endonuclease [Deltaproteobacteria bacterium]
MSDVKSLFNNHEEYFTLAKGGHKDIMNVYVKNKNGKPLMPCKPAKARKLLRDGKAKVVSRCPFTIQLLWDCEENVQEVTVGIDKGSSITGFSCVANGQILMSGEIHHRTDIKDKMDTRRANRRNRRARKWYRPERFLNRASSRRSGRLPPSIKANVEEVIRVVRKIPLPISIVTVEDVQVDVRRLSDTDVRGSEYQQSNRLDENLRLACLIRDDFTCQKCGKGNRRLQAHHIVWTTKGGKDSIYNLVTFCENCHDKVHKTSESGKVKLKGGKVVTGMDGFEDKIAQRTMHGKAYLYETLGQQASLKKVFGYQTSSYRKSLSLLKSHSIDALCVATLETGEVIEENYENFYKINFRPRQTRRQYHDLPRKGKGRVRYQVNAQRDGFHKGDIVRVKEKWVKQINSIYSNGYLAFARVSGEPNCAKPKDCQLLKRGQTMVWEKVV